MADPKEALDDINAIIKELQTDPYGKMNDAKVLRLVRLWVRSAVAIKGTGVFESLKIFFLRRGDPGKPSAKNPSLSWRDELYADIVAYKNALSFNSDNPSPAAFQAALDSMTDFVEDYRNQYKKGSNQDKVFEHGVRALFADEAKKLAAGQ